MDTGEIRGNSKQKLGCYGQISGLLEDVAIGVIKASQSRHLDNKLDNRHDLGDFSVSLSVPDTVLMYKVIINDGTICGGCAVKAYDF